MNDPRSEWLRQWALSEVQGQFGCGDRSDTLEQVSGDASFRRYFRLRPGPGGSYIAVDAPPEHEDNGRFVSIARLLRQAGLRAPEVYAVDLDRGFLLLEDLGDQLYLDTLLACQREGNDTLADELLRQAIDALVKLQIGVQKEQLDPYGQRELRAEMALFDHWFCGRLLGMKLDAPTRRLIERGYEFLEDAALAQPRVAVHRDYHSRNLMILPPRDSSAEPGIVDFQDAVSGAYTYDLVSLLRDCYIRWSPEQVNDWAGYYRTRAIAAGIIADVDADRLRRDFDLMGLQRHIKVLGIFSRLTLRDNKPRYLADIPLVVRYFREVAADYAELADLHDWFEHRVMPLLATAIGQDP